MPDNSQQNGPKIEYVPVSINPEDTFKIMDRIDQRGEAWYLEGSGQAGKFHANKSRQFVMTVDGQDSEIKIVLSADGTWKAAARIEVGEAVSR